MIIYVGIAGSTKLTATGGKHQGNCATQNVASKRNQSSRNDAADIPTLLLKHVTMRNPEWSVAIYASPPRDPLKMDLFHS